MGVQDLWVLIIVLGLCFQSRLLNSQNLSCHPNDLRALEDFLRGLESVIDGWGSNSSSNCCTWPGITCNSSFSRGLNDSRSSNRVVKLELVKKRLGGKLSEALGNLDQLRTLNLSHNYLREGLPASLFHLQNLEVLDLSSNDLSGLFPATIDLPSIQSIDISQNTLKGPIPVGVCGNSRRIRVLNLAENYFSGSLPPGLGNCSSLEHLCLGTNDLTGGLSEDIFRLQKLARLSLQDNMLSGPLSRRIGNLTSLFRLDISSNGFSGSIPDVFYHYGKLQYMEAHSNNFTGQIPPSLSISSTLTLLNLRNNSLEGHIDLNCSAMASLASLDLGSNRFYGSVPANLPSCGGLRTLNLARNNFRGQIPESFKTFQNLSYLSLSNSSIFNLSSALKILQQCRNLTTVVLTLNFHDEELPADPTIRFENLKVLIIANCRLTGSIPKWLSDCTKLQLLDLSWNRLNGTIPRWFGKFEFLFYLDLSNNSFTGEIPKSFTGLESLNNRNISLEEPSRDFPFFLKRNVSTRGLQYNQVWSFPPTLDLSHNNLSGPIWPEFGKLKKLHILDLKFNYLSGQIPSNLSGMASLENLDLSHNNLTGTIPPSLEKLSFLSKFNVAENHLSGEIPSGGQFQTFPNSSFEGNNLYFCGSSCRPSINKAAPPGSPNKSTRKRGPIIGMAIGIVFGTAFLLVLMFIILLRAHSRGEVDPEKEGDTNDKDLEQLGSRLVVLFQNMENNKELSLDDLLKSTNNFDQANIIGCGGFGLVYKATLPDGRKVAIKRLSGDCGQMEREFRAEVEALSRAQHPNLVHLQGYCMYKNDRLLIYSYMENSSLDYWLHEKLDGLSSLDWDTRLQIAQGAARGLAYLHQSCEPHILHRDIKSSNILLDENFEAYLADFGLARLILPYDTHVTTDLVGTLGYIPPEYGQASVATYKGDVYSFGVVLLELLTGRRPMDMCKPKGCRDLISWVFQMKKERHESEVFDPFVYDKQHDKEMLRVLEIACLCLSECPKVRPSTQQLVSWLDDLDINI
ncbi:phytosulfokine receptor 1 [Alnus glutinosa]|uniref:phytosulfokine receptor 1 n=1 Tax=Alnus glutinosa TaxID=3517 RepID=UPI002D7768CC|nr:phytosulfokine receptor 1 [Alnus glutinosa]